MNNYSDCFTLEDKINFIKEFSKDIEEIDDKRIKELNSYVIDIISIIKYSMRINNEMNYYSIFMDNLDLEIDYQLQAPAATYFKRIYFVIVVNPFLLFKFDVSKIRSIIIHEIYHIIFKHSITCKSIMENNPDEYTMEEMNIAGDIAVNEQIEDLRRDRKFVNLYTLADLGLCTESEINSVLNHHSYNNSLEQKDMISYLKLIHQVLKSEQKQKIYFSFGGSGNDEQGNSKKIVKDFDQGYSSVEYNYSKDKNKNSNLDEIQESIINNAIKDAAERCKGSIPSSIGKMIEDFNKKPIIKWQNVLKQFIGATPIPYKYTRNKLNRKQPERLDLYGTTNDAQVFVTAAFDTSGSISDEEYSMCLSEVYGICTCQKKKFDMEVILCDCDINNIYKVKSKKDFKKLGDRKGYGGTDFSPVFEHMNKRKLNRQGILVYFTDGYGEREIPKPVGYKVIWVLLNDNNYLSVNDPYGRVLSLNKKFLEEKYKKK